MFLQNHKKIILFLLGLMILAGSLFFLKTVSAQTADTFGLDTVGQNVSLSGQDIRVTIAKIINIFLGLLGIIALCIILYAGYLYMTAGGNEDQVTQAIGWIKNAVIGLAIILAAYIIVSFVINKLSGATGVVEDTHTIPQKCLMDENILATDPDCDFCRVDAEACCAENHFIVKSLTPNTLNTQMNNVVARALFSRPVHAKYQDQVELRKTVKIFKDNVDLTDKFDFVLAGDNRIIELRPNSAIGAQCGDGSNCLPFGIYKIQVQPAVSDMNGSGLEIGQLACGNFSAEANFTVGTRGKTGNGFLMFDGLTGYISMPASQDFHFANKQATLGLWVKFPISSTPTNGDNIFIINNFKGGNPGSGWYVVRSGNKIHFQHRAATSTQFVNDADNNIDIYSSKALNDNNWHFITYTFDGSTAKEYVDGVFDAQDTYRLLVDNDKFPSAGSADRNLDIGVLYPDVQGKTSGNYSGGLDDVRLYNKVLTAGQVALLYNSNKATSASIGGLLAWWQFDESNDSGYKEIVDSSGNNHNSKIIGNGITRAGDLNFYKDIYKDTIAPVVQPLMIAGTSAVEHRFKVNNKIYNVTTTIFDNSGFAYTYLKMEKLDVDNNILGQPIAQSIYYNGPSVARGSDAPSSNPYLSQMPLRLSSVYKEGGKYLLTVEAHDIDDNVSLATTTINLIPDSCNDGERNGDETAVDAGGVCGGGDGDGCNTDNDCAYSYKCIDESTSTDPNIHDGYCRAYPLIEAVSPSMDGAPGNYITVVGKHFGETAGTISFASGTDWITATMPNCGQDVWHDTWAVVSVPNFALSSTGAIKLVKDASYNISVRGQTTTTYDLSNDSWGPEPSKPGEFTINNIKRPGLCSLGTMEDIRDNDGNVVIPVGSNVGLASTPVLAIGTGFGTSQGSNKMWFGQGTNTKVTAWDPTNIKFEVPSVDVNKWYGVYTEVNNEKSNGLPFKVLNKTGLNGPIINEIFPASTTPGSYITIYGDRFGKESGHIYLASTPQQAIECSKKFNENKCAELSDQGFPNICKGKNWFDDHVVVQVPENLPLDLMPGERMEMKEKKSDLLALAGVQKQNLVDSTEEIKIINNASDYSLATNSSLYLELVLKNISIPGVFGYQNIHREILQKRADGNEGGESEYRVKIIDAVDKNTGAIQSRELDFYYWPTTLDKGGVIQSFPLKKNDNLRVKFKVDLTADKILNLYLAEGDVQLPNVPTASVSLADKIISSTVYPLQVGGINNNFSYSSFSVFELKKYFAEKTGSNSLRPYVLLKTADNLISSGNNQEEIINGSPKPSICQLDPNSGPAPLWTDKNLNIYGANLSTSIDNEIYFDTEKVDDKIKRENKATTNGWLMTVATAEALVGQGQKITTFIPFAQDDYGKFYSLRDNGPIIVKSNNGFSNSLPYDVIDCGLASSAEKESMKASNYQCCTTDGMDKGKWKPSVFICDGDKREAGYVWRFYTGKIPQVPRVVEECNEADWNDPSKVVAFPSPVPWTKWKSGTNACVNSTIAIRFSMSMDNATLNTSTIQVLQCGTGEAPVCGTAIADEDLDLIYESGVLKIKQAPPQLVGNTWYRVVLKDGIKSLRYIVENGKQAVEKIDLFKSRPCGTGTAYCYDFKTGTGDCWLTAAGINPNDHTSILLGVVQDERYPFIYELNKIFNVSGVHPLYFYLWGRGNQECSVMNVDNMDWKWGTAEPNADAASVVKRPTVEDEKPVYTDSRAYATGFRNTWPDFVNIVASSDKSRVYDLLQGAGIIGVLETTDINKNIVKVNDLFGSEFNTYNNYDLDFKFKLNEVATSSENYHSIDEYQKVYTRQLYNKGGSGAIYVIDKYYPIMKSRGREFVFAVGSDSLNDWKLDPDTTGSISYHLEKRGMVLSMFRGYGEQQPIEFIASTTLHYFSSSKAEVQLGGIDYSYPLAVDTYMNGSIEKLTVSPGNIVITATSSLTIDLGNPKVIDWWPNCSEACANGQIGVQFNMTMMTSTYKADPESIKMFECADEFCNNLLTEITLNKDASLFTDNKLIVTASDLLKDNTWYKVFVTGTIKAVGGIKDHEIQEGNPLESFSWRFRTKEFGAFCIPAKVALQPDPFVAEVIGQQTAYNAIPLSSPDNCSAFGQPLNPWGVGWQWSTREVEVATTTNFSAKGALKPYCGTDCLPLGSNIPYSASNTNSALYLCGNGTVDPGEDCDIGDKDNQEVVGVSCTLNCLRPGNKNKTTCGDGIVSSNLGEECDPKIVEQKNYCTSICTWKGSSQTQPEGSSKDAWCLGGTKTLGEDCDLKLTTTTNAGKIGCSDNCLHLGTKLSQYWCDNNASFFTSTPCKQAISVCGNDKKIEKGEECEIGLNGATVDTCADNCLLKDVCADSVLKQCKASDEGCSTDCTLAGSSLLYKVPSLCGDGESGTGEFKDCELTVGDYGIRSTLNNNPVQLITAVGLGEVNNFFDAQLNKTLTKVQKTTIIASASSYRDAKGEVKTFTPIVGNSTYYLQCGNTEYDMAEAGKYNDCASDSWQNGVATNSCCLPRPQRVAEYPVDGTGLKNNGNFVCPNTYLEVKFNKKIAENTLNQEWAITSGNTLISKPGATSTSMAGATATNIVIARGTNESCGNGEVDVSSTMRGLGLTLVMADNNQSTGFWQKIWQGVKQFFGRLFGFTALATTQPTQNSHWCVGSVTGIPKVSVQELDGQATTTVSIYLTGLLATSSDYAVFLHGGTEGIKDVDGVGIGNPDTASRDDVWLFHTGSKVCKIANVAVAPTSYLFDKPNTTTTFRLKALTKEGQQIISMPGIYSWDWVWGPQDNEVFAIPFGDTTSTKDQIIIGANAVEGYLTAYGQTVIKEDVDIVSRKLPGTTFTAPFDLSAYFCENIWPAKNGDGSWSEFKDPIYNFSFHYCADAGVSGDKSDDLPYLAKEEITDIKVLGDPDNLKKYLLFSDKNDDAIGLQIIKNLKRKTALEWFTDEFENAPPPKTITLAGYDGAQDGDNYYLNALNVNTTTKDVYNNIYQFSLSKGAQASTMGVLTQILDSLKFNTNLFDLNLCGDTQGNPNKLLNKSCTNDLDCAGESMAPICLADKTKLARDYQRIKDVAGIQDKIKLYYERKNKYPDLKKVSTFEPNLSQENLFASYLPGYVVSRWPSWGGFGQLVLNGAVPVDPINYWECPDGYDQQTCWNATTLSYFCSATSSVYEYSFNSSTHDYQLNVPFEYLHIANYGEQGDILGDNLDLSNDRVTSTRGCDVGYAQSLLGERCGDGLINKEKGEQCDPPGLQDIFITTLNNEPASIARTCDMNCQWQESAAVKLYTCGNGIVESGESCDDGILNGQYGQCAGLNDGYFSDGTTAKACQTLHSEYCGNNGSIDVGANGKAVEFCEQVPQVQVSQSLNLGTCGHDNERYCVEDANCFGALSFVADDSFVKYDGDLLKNLFGSSFTLTVWYKKDNARVEQGGPIMVLVDEIANKFALLYSTADKIEFKVGSRTDYHLVSTTENGSEGWNHLALVYEKTKDTNKIFLYINGENKKEINNFIIPEEINNINQLFIGGAADTSFFNIRKNFLGLLDEPKIFNTVLTGDEVKRDYQAGNGVFGNSAVQENLILGWHFDEKNGVFAYNYQQLQPTGGRVFSQTNFSKFANAINEAGWIDSGVVKDSCDNISPKYTRLLYGDNWHPVANLGEICGNDYFCLDSINLLNRNVFYNRTHNSELAKGHCALDSRLLCENSNDCQSASSDYSSPNVLLASKFDPLNPEAWLGYFRGSVIPYGNCIKDNKKLGSLYNLFKEESCSWDCQKYGEYCGDKIINGSEQCDDGNIDNNDNCLNNCTMPEVPVIEPGTPVCGNNKLEGTEQCDDGNLKDGDGCSHECKTEPTSCGDKIVQKDGNTAGVKEACDEGKDKNGVACIPGYGKQCVYCSADCRKTITVDPTMYCGNGVIEQQEVCDAKDGIVYVPHDTAILLNPMDTSGELTRALSCNKKQPKNIGDYFGSFSCTNNCASIVDTCVTCGKISTGAVATAKFMNVLAPYASIESGRVFAWPLNDNQLGLNISYFDAQTNTTSLNSNIGVVFDVKSSPINLLTNIGTDALCKNKYSLSFDYASEKGDYFDYPVNGEGNKVENTYLVSPPTPTNTFRIVVRWTAKEANKGARFQGIVYNSGFIGNGSESGQITYVDAVTTATSHDLLNPNLDRVCRDIDYEKNCVGKHYNGVYIHDTGDIDKKVYVQSFTIDTDKRGIQTQNYAFAVDEYGLPKAVPSGFSSPIMPFIDGNVQVEVYEPHPGKMSFYKPDYVFSLKRENIKNYSEYLSGTAEYWHPFDLVYNSTANKYEVEAEKNVNIGLDWQSIIDSVPASDGGDAVVSGYSLLNMNNKKLDSSYYFGTWPTTVNKDFLFTSLLMPNDIWNNLNINENDGVYVFGPQKNNESTLINSGQNCRESSGVGSCYQSIKNSTGSVVGNWIENGDVVCLQDPPQSNPNCRLEQSTSILKLTENNIYRFLVKFPISLSDAVLKNPSSLANVNELNGVRLFMGFANDQGNFVSTTLPIRLNSLHEIKNNNEQIWYLFSAFLKNNNIYISIKDEFVPLLSDYSILSQYDN